MSYLPELREALVKAAERQVRGAPAPMPVRRRSRPLGSLALLGASLAAVAAAVLVLVLVGHRRAAQPAPASVPYGSRAAAVDVAAHLLSSFHAPAGAVRLATDPTRPRQLGGPPVGVPAAGGVDLHSFFRMPGDPQTVINEVSSPRSLGAWSSGGGGTSSGSAGTNGQVQEANETFDLAPTGGIARRFEVSASSLPGGRSAVRIDAQAWWLVPRPSKETLPTDVSVVKIQLIGRPPAGSAYHPPAQVTGAKAHEVVSVLNALPVQQPGAASCPARASFRIVLRFVGTGQHPEPTAIIGPECGSIDLTLAGHRQPRLSWLSPATGADELATIRLAEILAGAPETRSLRDLIAASRQVSSQGSASAPRRAQRATGATPTKAP